MSLHKDFQPSTISPEELKAKYAQKELFSFTGYLARKGENKSYEAENKSSYWFNYIGIGLGSVLRIIAAFFAVYTLLKGVFNVTGSFAGTIAGTIAAGALVILERQQILNATRLLERWFFKQKMVRAYLGWALLFSSLTLICSLYGIGDAVRAISEEVSPYEFNAAMVNPTLAADIDAKKIEIEKFYAASTYKGKLDGPNQKTYKRELSKLDAMRTQLREEISVAEKNAKSSHETAIAEKTKNDGDNTFYAIILMIITEALFWFCFYHKERYEFFCYAEKMENGAITQAAAPNPPKSTAANPPLIGFHPAQNTPANTAKSVNP